MATDIGTKAGTFLTGLNTQRLFLGLLVGKNLEVDLSTTQFFYQSGDVSQINPIPADLARGII